MRKLASIFLVLALSVSPCFAGSVQDAVTGVIAKKNTAAGTVAYCTAAATCNTPPAQCDVVCEDFDTGSTDCDGAGGGTDANCNFSFTVVNTNITEDFTATAGGSYGCPGTTNTNVLQIAVGAASAAGYVRKDAGGDVAAGFTQFYFNMTASNLSDGQLANVIAIFDSGGNFIGRFRIANRSGTYYFLWSYYDSSASTSTSSDGTNAISIGTWYRVNIAWDGANNLSSKVNGAADIAVADFTATRVPRRFYFGPSGTASNTLTYQFDNWTVDDDTEPSACN